MHIVWRLLIAEVLGFGALVVVALALAAYGMWDARAHGSGDLFGPGGAARALFGFTLIFGALPVALFGAPGYVLLHARHLARWRWVLLLGVAPSFLFLAVEPELFWWAAGCGAAVATITHAIGRKLRGLASIAPIGHEGTGAGAPPRA